MNTHKLIYDGPEEGLYTKYNFSNFVLSDLAKRLEKDIKINPENINNNYTIYNIPELGIGIQYIIHPERYAQVGLLLMGKDIVSEVILQEAEKF